MIINGLDFVIIKSIIEFIYCGETNVTEENMKFMIAAAKAFQIRGLQSLVSDEHNFDGRNIGKGYNYAMQNVNNFTTYLTILYNHLVGLGNSTVGNW